MPGAFPTSPHKTVAAIVNKNSAATLSRCAPPTPKSYQKPVPEPSHPQAENTFLNILGPSIIKHNDRKKPKFPRTSEVSFNSPSTSIAAGLWEILGNLVSGRRVVSPANAQDGGVHVPTGAAVPVISGDDKVASTTAQTLKDAEAAMEKKDDQESISAPNIPSSYGPKGFHIPPETVKAILDDLKHEKVYWQSSWYRGAENQKVIVHYCKTLESAEEVAKLFLADEVLGFDIEWKMLARASDGIRKNVSLVQLANEERVALFHIARFKKGDGIEDLVPPTLKIIMESPKISKVGVSVQGDCTRLRKFMGIEARGLLELSHIHKIVQYAKGQSTCLKKRLVSLATQAEEHLGLPLWKGKVRSSDWSQDLNVEQVQYAASDSYAGLQIFYTLDAKRLALDTVPPRPAHAELGLPLRLTTGDTFEADDEHGVVLEAEQSESSSESEAISLSEGDQAEDLSDSLFRTSIEVNEVPKTIPVPQAPEQAASSPAPPKPAIEAANLWISQWRAMQPTDSKGKAYPAALRAYALWHIQGHDCSTIAALLRDPPLKGTSAATYVLDALMLENLPFDSDRVPDVMTNLPDLLQAKSKRYFERRQNQFEF